MNLSPAAHNVNTKNLEFVAAALAPYDSGWRARFTLNEIRLHDISNSYFHAGGVGEEVHSRFRVSKDTSLDSAASCAFYRGQRIPATLHSNSPFTVTRSDTCSSSAEYLADMICFWPLLAVES